MFNTNDASNQIIRRSKKQDKTLNTIIETVKSYDLVPRKNPRECWTFFDERGTPEFSSESPHTVPYNRRGEWVEMTEKVKR